MPWKEWSQNKKQADFKAFEYQENIFKITHSDGIFQT